MTTTQHETDVDGNENRSVNRRTLLKAAGTATVAGTALAAPASAHNVSGVPHFCGCSQVCACGSGYARVIVAEEYDGGFKKYTVKRSFNFCYEVSDEDKKIIAIKVDDEVWCNPNTCAQKALDYLDIDCDTYNAETNQCGKPPCEHPGIGNGPNGINGK